MPEPIGNECRQLGSNLIAGLCVAVRTLWAPSSRVSHSAGLIDDVRIPLGAALYADGFEC